MLLAECKSLAETKSRGQPWVRPCSMRLLLPTLVAHLSLTDLPAYTEA